MFPLTARCSVTPRWLAKPTGTITIPLKHRRADAMFASGTRCTIDYLIGKDRSDDASWLRITSGKLDALQIPDSSSPTAGKTVTFSVEDDWRVMEHLQLWPVPGSAIGSQGAAAYDVRSGDAETVIKGYAAANAGRLPYPLTMATNAHRGSTVFGSARFVRMADQLVPLAAAGGVGIRVDQVGSGLVLDVYVPVDRSARTLSEAAGTLTSWALTKTGPSATAIIVGTDGEGTLRHFSMTQDTALRDEYGDYIEAFVDARDLLHTQTSEVAQRAAAALLTGQPQAGWSVTMAETDVVRYGRNLLVGDLVKVQVTPNLALIDRLSECTLTWGDKGLTVAPKVGAATSQSQPNRLLARGIASALRGIQSLRSSL